MQLEHECWWTRRCETELSDHGTTLTGAGILPSALKVTASLLGASFDSKPSPDDEHGEVIVLGAIARGGSHDGCFIHFEPVSPSLKEAMLDAVLRLHGQYLGANVDWSPIQGHLLDKWRSGSTLRIRALPKRRQLMIRSYPVNANFFTRLAAPKLRVECGAGDRARLTEGS